MSMPNEPQSADEKAEAICRLTEEQAVLNPNTARTIRVIQKRGRLTRVHVRVYTKDAAETGKGT